MLVLLTLGVVLFHSVTPGVVSLAGPLAQMRAESEAIAQFPLGAFIGRGWYAVFPATASFWEVAVMGILLAMVSALVTSFAGVIADPVQVATGTHQRRLQRLITRVELGGREGLAREHLAARIGDLSDVVLVIWRSLRG